MPFWGQAEVLVTGSCRQVISVQHPFHVYMLMSTKDQEHAVSLIIILELWLLTLFFVQALHPFKQSTSWGHLFLLKRRELCAKLFCDSLVSGRPPPMCQALEPGGGWNAGRSHVIPAKGSRKWWDLCPTRGRIPAAARHQMSGSRLDARSSCFSKKPEIPICM